MYRKSDYNTLAAVSRLHKMQNSVLSQKFFFYLIASIVILVILIAQIFIYRPISREQ